MDDQMPRTPLFIQKELRIREYTKRLDALVLIRKREELDKACARLSRDLTKIMAWDKSTTKDLDLKMAKVRSCCFLMEEIEAKAAGTRGSLVKARDQLSFLMRKKVKASNFFDHIARVEQDCSFLRSKRRTLDEMMAPFTEQEKILKSLSNWNPRHSKFIKVQTMAVREKCREVDQAEVLLKHIEKKSAREEQQFHAMIAVLRNVHRTTSSEYERDEFSNAVLQPEVSIKTPSTTTVAISSSPGPLLQHSKLPESIDRRRRLMGSVGELESEQLAEVIGIILKNGGKLMETGENEIEIDFETLGDEALAAVEDFVDEASKVRNVSSPDRYGCHPTIQKTRNFFVGSEGDIGSNVEPGSEKVDMTSSPPLISSTVDSGSSSSSVIPNLDVGLQSEMQVDLPSSEKVTEQELFR